MRNVLKAETLERRFPLLSVENGCIVSKDADLTVAFEVELPELYTVTADEYEAMHSSWIKAVKVLPEHSVVCKQDWFVKETYRPKTDDGEQSFLTRSYELHFNERPYLNHKCYLFLTKTTRERSRRKSDFNTLCRGFLLPKEITDKDAAARFLEAVEQFERIMNDSGHIRLRRLETDEITGTKERPGLVENTFPSRWRMRPPYCRTSASSPAGCASVTNASACIPFRYGRPARQTFHGHALREDVHGPQRLPPLLCRTRRTAAVMQPHLFAIRVHRRRTGNPADDGEKLAQYALVVKIQPEQCR